MSAWQVALRCTCARLVRSAPVQRRLCTLHAPARCAQGFRISQNVSERTLLWKAVHPSAPRSSVSFATTLVNCVRAASTKTPAAPADDLFWDDDIDDVLAGATLDTSLPEGMLPPERRVRRPQTTRVAKGTRWVVSRDFGYIREPTLFWKQVELFLQQASYDPDMIARALNNCDARILLDPPQDCAARAYQLWQRFKERGWQLTASHYHQMVAMLGQHITGYNMASVLEEMNSYGIVPNQRTFQLLLQVHERAKDIDGAMRTLALMADYKVYVTVEHARVVLSIYKSLDLASGALNFVKGMKERFGRAPDARCYTDVMRIYAERGAKEDADEVLSLLLEAGLKPIADTFSVLAKAYAKAGDIGGGLDVIELQRRHGLQNVAAYNSVLNYYVKRNDAAGVERIQAMIAEHAVEPDEATGNVLLRFLVGRGDWKAAYEMFEDMKRGRANSRDILPYATLLKAHAEQGDVESMASLLLELKARQMYRTPEFDRELALMFYGPGLSRDDKLRMYRLMRGEELLAVFTATTMFLRHDLVAGRIDEAFETLEWLEDHSVDVNIWMVNALLEFCVRHARLDMLDAALARLSKHGLRGNVVTYNWMLDACAVSECTQKAERIIEIMVGNGLQPDARVFHLLARTYLAVGDHANAIATLQRMDAAGIAPPMVTYHAMMKSFASANDPEAAYDMVRRIQVEGNDVTGPCGVYIDRAGLSQPIERVLGWALAVNRSYGYHPPPALMDRLLKRCLDTQNAPAFINLAKLSCKSQVDVRRVVDSLLHASTFKGAYRTAEQLLDAVRQTEVPHDMLGPLARDLLEQGKAASDMKETPGDAIAPDLPRMRSGIIAAALLDSGVKPATTAAQDGGGGDVPEGEAEAAETETAWPGKLKHKQTRGPATRRQLQRIYTQSNIELMTGNADLAAKRLLVNWHRKYCSADDIVDVTTRLLGPGERVGQMCAVIETLKGDGFEWPPAIYAGLLGHACDTPDLAALQRCTETMRELGVLTAPLALRAYRHLMERGQIDEARQLLADIDRAAEGMDNVPRGKGMRIRSAAYMLYFRTVVQVNPETPAALLLDEWMAAGLPLIPAVWGALLKVALRNDSADSLSALTLRMCDANDFYVSLNDAAQMLERLVDAGHADTAVRYLETEWGHDKGRQALLQLLDKYVKAGPACAETPAATFVMERLKEYGNPDDPAAAFTMLLKSRLPEEPTNDVDRFMKRAGVAPTLQYFTVAIARLATRGRRKDVTDMYWKMRGCKIEPDSVVFDMLMNSITKDPANQRNEIVALRNLNDYIVLMRGMRDSGVSLSLKAFEGALRLCACSKKLGWWQAPEVMQIARECGIKTHTPSMAVSFVQSLVHGNKVDEALKYLREHLDTHASDMDEETQLRLHTTVMHGFQLRGEHHRARHVFKDMRRRDLTADKFAMKFFNVSRNILYPDQAPRREDSGDNEDEGEWNDSNV